MFIITRFLFIFLEVYDNKEIYFAFYFRIWKPQKVFFSFSEDTIVVSFLSVLSFKNKSH